MLLDTSTTSTTSALASGMASSPALAVTLRESS